MQEELDAAVRAYDLIVEFFVNYSFQVIGAILILIAGFVLARYASRWLVALCERRGIDVTLSHFFGNCVNILILACFVIIALGKFGISVAPFVAAIGAVSLGAGLALQGNLANFGAGLSIILTRPFVVGNTITVQGVTGLVEEIRLAATILSTEDGEQILVPNRHIIGEIQFNSFENRIVESVVGIDYASDPLEAVERLRECLRSLDCVVGEPEPQVGIDEFADSSINIGLRYWVPTNTYHQSRFSANKAVWRTLQEAGIQIPFPRRVVDLVASAD